MWYDVLIVCILLFFTMRGAAKGVVWQIAHIAGIIICFTFADAISTAAGPYVHLEPPLNHWVIMVAAYLACTFVCFAIAGGMTNWIEKNRMKEYDKHLGGLLGLVKGAILATILTFAVVTVSEKARESLRSSHSGRIMALAMDRLHPFIPKQMHDRVADYIHLLDHPDLDLHAHDHDHDHGSSTPPKNGDTQLGSPAPLPSSNSGLSYFLNQIRAVLGDDAQQVVSQALSQTSDPQAQESLQQKLVDVLNVIPESERSSLKQQILQGGAAQLENLLSWKSQQATSGSQPPPVTPVTTPSPPAPIQTADRRTELVQEIAAKYAMNASQQTWVAEQIERDLAGLPSSVALAVLEDWRSDIYAGISDPDPTTHSGSLLESRMLRQVQRFGITIESLPASVQQRLRSVQAQSPSNGSPL